MLLDVNKYSSGFGFFINIVILFMLLSPIASILTIVYYSYWGKSSQNGILKEEL